MSVQQSHEFASEKQKTEFHARPAGPKVPVWKEAGQKPDGAPGGKGYTRAIILLVVLTAGGLTLYRYVRKGIGQRVAAQKVLAEEVHDSDATVAIVHPKVSDKPQELVLPGNTQAYVDAPIYARTSGYLKKFTADLGERVKSGQLLAEIESPEVDQQLIQARSDLQTAQTNLKLAQITADRYSTLAGKGAIARQDADNVLSDRDAKKTIADSAAANVKRLETMQAFENVYAPFDGVVTARNADMGQLVQAGAGVAGAGGIGKELFHMASTSKLRVFVSVPENNQNAARPGSQVQLTLGEYPGRVFPATIVRDSGAIDPVSRTLLVEVDVENPTDELLPGAYLQVHFKYAGTAGSGLIIPVNTVLFRSEGLRVGVVRNGRAVLTPITVGRDYGDSLEVTTGLSAGDSIILNPNDSLVSGQPVKVLEQNAN